VDHCKRAGVDEIACLLDFGVPVGRVMASLPFLNQLRQESNTHLDSDRALDDSTIMASQPADIWAPSPATVGRDKIEI
jgi:hypothetical protein